MPENIIVVGDGQVGLAAAIALRKALPRTQVRIAGCSPDPAALADRAMTCLPQTTIFHERLGLDERGFVLRSGVSHRLAVQFAGWQHGASSYLNGYGAAGLSPSASGILSVSQQLAAENRFAHPADDSASPLSDVDYALRFDPAAYNARLAALANHLGLERVGAPMKAAVPDGAGGISFIKLDTGESCAADLFVDCTGPKALLANAITPAKFESWSAMLPCDRVIVSHAPPEHSPRVTDLVEAHPLGWRSTALGRDQTYRTSGYNSGIGSGASKDGAGDAITIKPGRLMDGWTGNVVAFGDAAVAFEPLHWANLTLAHAQISLFLEMLPGRTLDPLERSEYNRRAGAMADRARDYIALHYCAPARPVGAFWDYAASLRRSDGLSLTLSEFVKRGRLPFFEEDILSRDAWQAAMACIGIASGSSALLRSVPEGVLADRLEMLQKRSATALTMAADYSAWLQNYIEDRP